MRRIIFTVFLILIGRTVFAQAGTLDPSFADQGISYLNFLSTEEEWLTHSVIDGEDRIWLAGQTYQDNDWKLIVSRLNPDGSMDMSFSDQGYAIINIGANSLETVEGLSLAGDALIIAGRTVTDGESSPYLLKYSEEGFLDTDFGELGLATAPVDMNVSDIHIDGAGNIFMSGFADGDVMVIKFLPNGSLDQFFGFFGATIADFPSEDESLSIDLDEEGNIYVFGRGALNNVIRGHITSFLPNGAMNTDFTANGRKSITWTDNKGFFVNEGMITEDGDKMILVGRVENLNIGNANFAAALVQMDSNLDVEFGENGLLELDLGIGGADLASAVIEGPGGFYISANVAELPQGINSLVVHTDLSGELVQSFAGTGIANVNVVNQNDDQVSALAFQSDGNLIMSGVASNDEIGVFGYAARIITSDALNVSNLASLHESKIYPNPARDFINVTLSDEYPQGIPYTIYDHRGAVVLQGIMQSQLETIDVSALPVGGYILQAEQHVPQRWIKIQ
jgi:uncharacterized delta-60 repeat protein